MNRYRILIVDDEPLIRESLREDLEEANYEAIEAVDGAEAWKILEKDHNFRVIMLDKMMPNMSGEELLKKIRSHENLKSIPVIMQTAKDNIKDVYSSYEDGCDWYLSKPYKKKLMLEIVEKSIKKSFEHIK